MVVKAECMVSVDGTSRERNEMGILSQERYFVIFFRFPV